MSDEAFKDNSEQTPEKDVPPPAKAPRDGQAEWRRSRAA